MWIFNKKDDVIEETKEEATLQKEETKSLPTDEYVWVEGYKGTDRYMICKGLRYDMDIIYDLGEEPILYKKGFHFCLNLKDVYKYYPLNGENRYFKVKGLVKPLNVDDVYNKMTDKLVAKQIKFIEEIDVSEELKKEEEKRRSIKRNSMKNLLPFATDEEINKCLEDENYIETVLYNRFKKIGINEDLSFILYGKMKFTYSLNHRNFFHTERLYNKTIRLIEFAESLYKEDISNDMKLYLLLQEIYRYNEQEGNIL